MAKLSVGESLAFHAPHGARLFVVQLTGGLCWFTVSSQEIRRWRDAP